MAKGIVYCLTNPEMPELVKIGLVDGEEQSALEKRLNDLYSTGVPVPFELYYAVSVEDERRAETLLHQTFADRRVNKKREFFRIPPERVVSAMQLTGGKEINFDSKTTGSEIQESDIQARERSRQLENKRRSAFKFSDAGIPIGAELQFSRDRSITATVKDEKHIEYGGELLRTSTAAKIILKGMGLRGTVAGPDYWLYQDDTLTDLRRRKEAEMDGQIDEEE